jgi:hypothetical protein
MATCGDAFVVLDHRFGVVHVFAYAVILESHTTHGFAFGLRIRCTAPLTRSIGRTGRTENPCIS